MTGRRLRWLALAPLTIMFALMGYYVATGIDPLPSESGIRWVMLFILACIGVVGFIASTVSL